MQKIYAEFCRLRDLRDAGAEAPKYTEAQAFAKSLPPCAAEATSGAAECCSETGATSFDVTERRKP